MIRIDEIYNNTFWPWFEKNLPGFRMYQCEPFGRSDYESVINYGRDDIHEHNYIFFFDQEPIHLDIHSKTFWYVNNCNLDISHNIPVRDVDFRWDNSMKSIKRTNDAGFLVTSEKNSDDVDKICKQFDWKSAYYFFHGWASLDWYRGYDKTFLITPIDQRTITKTFISPNRIVAGKRQHRLELLYYIFKNNLLNNHISCPRICPEENISVLDAVTPLISKYPDIQEVFKSQSLPINFDGETDHPMHSCWLSLFKESAESLLYLVTETVASGRRWHLTEKTFKPIALGMPFIIVGTQGSLEYLRSYGFQTFSSIWDESYDLCDDSTRMHRIAELLTDLDRRSVQEKQQLFDAARPIIEHNWNHFYNGGFEQILWQELTGMLNDIKSHS
jgi:hypothetical protein